MTATESIAGRLAAAARGSALIQIGARLLASMRVQPEGSPAQVAADLSALRSLFRGSALASRLADRFGGAIGANPGSLALRVLARRRQDIEGLEPWQVIRAAAIAALTAVAIVGIAALVDPRPSSGYRWWLWIVTAAVSTAVALAARALAAARGGSRVLSRLP